MVLSIGTFSNIPIFPSNGKKVHLLTPLLCFSCSLPGCTSHGVALLGSEWWHLVISILWVTKDVLCEGCVGDAGGLSSFLSLAALRTHPRNLVSSEVDWVRMSGKEGHGVLVKGSCVGGRKVWNLWWVRWSSWVWGGWWLGMTWSVECGLEGEGRRIFDCLWQDLILPSSLPYFTLPAFCPSLLSFLLPRTSLLDPFFSLIHPLLFPIPFFSFSSFSFYLCSWLLLSLKEYTTLLTPLALDAISLSSGRVPPSLLSELYTGVLANTPSFCSFQCGYPYPLSWTSFFLTM